MPKPQGSGNEIVAGDFRGSWADLPDVASPAVSAILADGQLMAAAGAWRHAVHGGESLITAAGRMQKEEALALRKDGFALVESSRLIDPLQTRPAEEGRLWLLTSGSTGRPKRVGHTLASLTTVTGAQPPRRWLCPYLPGAYAWWQVVTLSLAHDGQDVVFVESDQLDEWPTLALSEGVTAISGTPTFWRQALLRSADTMARLRLAQVTLGGEPVDQAILDRLAELYPSARISWIYASSEAGAAIAVHDKRAGFPEEWLNRDAPGRPRLAVEDDELLVASSASAAGFSGMMRTGDRVESRDGRVLITGRLATDEINVGGSKASASMVRDVLTSHPEVLWAQVRGRRAPIVGHVVAADVVLRADGTGADLSAWCAERLPDYAVPRRVRVLDEIPLKESLKSDV
jgi:acyl-CoA synthetase (AMP-forming)/AMP-acid ligase II